MCWYVYTILVTPIHPSTQCDSFFSPRGFFRRNALTFVFSPTRSWFRRQEIFSVCCIFMGIWAMGFLYGALFPTLPQLSGGLYSILITPSVRCRIMNLNRELYSSFSAPSVEGGGLKFWIEAMRLIPYTWSLSVALVRDWSLEEVWQW